MKKIAILLLILLLTLLVLPACSNGDNSQEQSEENEKQEELEKITVTLDWTPNTNHTGLYVAKDKGFFEEVGLEVEIIQPSGGTAEQLVASDKADFGVSYQEQVTLARVEDIPIVSLAAVIQHNTSGFASFKDKGIEDPKDFEGKKYGGWGSPIEQATLKVLMEKDGGDVNEVDIITSGDTDFFVASERDIDFAWIFEAWTGIEAQLRGIELNYIDLGKEDENLDYYTPVIITNEDKIQNNSDLISRFMKATAKGYEFTIENHNEAAQILLDNAPELDEDLVRASQEWLSSRYQADAEKWGLQKREVWDNYTNWLFERDLIEKNIDTTKAFTNDFL